MANYVDIQHLKPGMVIVQITQQNGPVKIRKAGLVTSDAMVQGLAEMGVQEVEIDPEQTVQIDAPSHTTTQTQALLRGQYDKGTQFDHTLSEQFNRSLFLPTVQGLPSVWKGYSKRAVSMLAVVGLGFAIGYGAATYENWMLVKQPPVAQQPSDNINLQPQPQQLASTSSQDSVGEASTEPQNAALPIVTETTGQAEQVGGSTEPVITRQPSQTGANPIPAATRALPSEELASEVTPSQGVSTTSEVTRSSQYEGRVLTQTPQNTNQTEPSTSDVSADLMARLNQALEDIEREPVRSTTNRPHESLRVHDNIQRVDELPVRLLTELPSMSFNGHMYASRPRDRWVRVNGKQLGEGDWINNEVQILEIDTQRVILGFQGEVFSMVALGEW